MAKCERDCYGNWYIERTTKTKKSSKRNWYFVRELSNKGVKRFGGVCLTTIVFPEEFIGKRVRFKIELLETRKRRTNYW